MSRREKKQMNKASDGWLTKIGTWVNGLKTWQKIAIPAADEVMKSRIEAVKQLILGEVNVKELVFVDGDGILVKKIKCNFRTLGKKFGKLMKSVNAAVTEMSQEQISQLEKNGNITLQVEGVDALSSHIFQVVELLT